MSLDLGEPACNRRAGVVCDDSGGAEPELTRQLLQVIGISINAEVVFLPPFGVARARQIHRVTGANGREGRKELSIRDRESGQP